MTQFLSQQWLAYNKVESVNTQASKLVSWASNVAIIVELIARETQRRKCFKRKWIRICMPIFFTLLFSSNFQWLAGSLTKPLISLLHNFWVVVFLDQVGALEDKKVENCSRTFRHIECTLDIRHLHSMHSFPHLHTAALTRPDRWRERILQQNKH